MAVPTGSPKHVRPRRIRLLAVGWALGLVTVALQGTIVAPEAEAIAAFDNCREAPVNAAFGVDDPTSASVYRLYCAYFLRYPDMAGYEYWLGIHTAGRMNLRQISDYFANSEEFGNTYSSLSNAEFIDLIYRNVMERPPDQEGYHYWLRLLNDGRVTRGYVMLLLSDSSEFRTKTGT